MLKVKAFEFNPFGEKTYVVYDPDSRQCAIVDPGMENDSETAVLDRWITENKLSVKYLIATHTSL